MGCGASRKQVQEPEPPVVQERIPALPEDGNAGPGIKRTRSRARRGSDAATSFFDIPPSSATEQINGTETADKPVDQRAYLMEGLGEGGGGESRALMEDLALNGALASPRPQKAEQEGAVEAKPQSQSYLMEGLGEGGGGESRALMEDLALNGALASPRPQKAEQEGAVEAKPQSQSYLMEGLGEGGGGESRALMEDLALNGALASPRPQKAEQEG